MAFEPCRRPAFAALPVPHGSFRLTDDVVQAGKDSDAAFEKAIQRGDFAEDDSRGHALSHDPVLRVVQLHFVELAEAHLANFEGGLAQFLRRGPAGIGAEVLGCAKDKQALVPDLTATMRDPSPAVRNNATRLENQHSS